MIAKPALKRAVWVGSAFALAAGALQIGAAPAYAVAGPTVKYECRDLQTPGKLFPGDEVACTLTVSTTGNDSFTNITAEVTIPTSTVYESGGTLLVGKDDRASVNTFGLAETPISELVDAPAGVTPKIEVVTTSEPKKNYVSASIIDNGQKIDWRALCTATAQEKTQSFTIKITAPGQQPVQATETVLLGDNVANQGLAQPAACAPKP
ncbi:hypothetical protein VMT65_26220 [Nocardia sp. CDC153]|uniref:hypothetical protein n=1 Tax=Nocardia sp. CDC153 TaxID=3112167 RepID=UPI002DBFEFAF|nr:hypothetical protein [Nocardia sp. CDC153]MEC3956557.1 hypothetical protein [Nocardia sp. CDC153]